MPKPLCFILMPFGNKKSPDGRAINFDAVYGELIKPAILKAGLEPIRADEEQVGGVIHKPMFERLVLCEFAVADLTTANANVFYELGVRHATRPASTVLMFASSAGAIPFDTAMLRALPYDLGADGKPFNTGPGQAALVKRLKAALKAREKPPTDSPLYQLLTNYPDIQHEKTDVFHKRVTYSAELKQTLADARVDMNSGLATMRAIGKKLTAGKEDLELGVWIDLMLGYRDIEAFDDMVDLIRKMPAVLGTTTMAREQLGFALNRLGKREEAERVLKAVLAERGPSSETYGLLGRVYKDRWQESKTAKAPKAVVQGLLASAIDCYLKGFEADARDFYPGINALTLMDAGDPPDPRRKALLPVVTYALERRIAAGHAGYWEYATRLELAVLAGDKSAAEEALGRADILQQKAWMLETTAKNLATIREARGLRGERMVWAEKIEATLREPAKVK
jgi:tetratricopeptide (TPR) repeat protein